MAEMTVTPLHFRATAADRKHLDEVATALRAAGQPYLTKTAALRLCLAAAAVDPRAVISESAK